jgi:branched-chain amino acid transport system ATP-binding protein
LLGLAPKIVDRVFEVIKGIQAAGATIVMVERNAFAALELWDRSYMIEQGRLTLTGTGRELLENPQVKAAVLVETGETFEPQALRRASEAAPV